MGVLRPSVDNIRSLTNFTQMFRWAVQFESFPNLVSGYSSDDINFRAESTTIPKLTGESTEIQIRGNKIKEPGIHNYEGTITLTCIETVDNVVASFIRDWREACWETNSGLTHYKEEVEAVIQIIRLDNMDQPIWTYKLVGCFLEDTDWGGDLDGSTGDPLKPGMTISYDYFEDSAQQASPA